MLPTININDIKLKLLTRWLVWT